MITFYALLETVAKIILVFDVIAIGIACIELLNKRNNKIDEYDPETDPCISMKTLTGFLFYLYMKEHNLDNIAFHYNKKYDIQITINDKTVNILSVEKGLPQLEDAVYMDKS